MRPGRAEEVLRLKAGEAMWRPVAVLGDSIYVTAAHQVVRADLANREMKASPLPAAVSDPERVAGVVAMASERGARLVLAYASRPLFPVVDAPGSSRILCLDYPSMRISEIGRAPSHAPLLAAAEDRLWAAWTDRQHTSALRVITVGE